MTSSTVPAGPSLAREAGRRAPRHDCLEPEVVRWLEGLTDDEFGRAQFSNDRLEDQGVHLDEPSTRQLRRRLRELRFYMGRERQRVTYYLAGGRRIILLKVFRKTNARESQEIDRAEGAMQQCLASGHTPEDEDA